MLEGAGGPPTINHYASTSHHDSQESLEGAGGPPATDGEDGGFVSAAGRLFQLLPTNAIDTQEPFAAGEDPVAYVMDSLRWIYPPIDMVLETRAAGSPLRDGVSSQRCVCVCEQVWPEKTTDLALTWPSASGRRAPL